MLESNKKKTARLAGVLYLLMVFGAIGIVYVPSQMIIEGDAVATVNNILDKEFLLRLGIFSNLFCQVVFLFLALTLYRLFEDVSKKLSITLLAIVIASVPVAFVISFNHLNALYVMKESLLSQIATTEKVMLATAYLKQFDYGISVIGIFWGLWLIPFGQLVVKSGFIPKIIGYLLIMGGISYIIDASTFILIPQYYSVSNVMTAIFATLAEFSAILWLLIKGVKEKGLKGIST